MLNKILIICSLTVTTFAGLQANEEISPQVGSAIENKRPARTCNKCPKKGKKNGKKKIYPRSTGLQRLRRSLCKRKRQ